ncbi:MAG: hypothetical protein PHG00_11120 [Methylococcales bacterium]|nr:hypothetical protein [Methylococcales bacterium]
MATQGKFQPGKFRYNALYCKWLKNWKDDPGLAAGYQCFAMVGDFNASVFENISFSPNKLKYKRGKGTVVAKVAPICKFVSK